MEAVRARVEEADLHLPISVADLTAVVAGPGAHDHQLAVTQCGVSRLDWFKSRLAFYTGVEYAEQRLCDGSRTGILIAAVILAFNVFIFFTVGFWMINCLM